MSKINRKLLSHYEDVLNHIGHVVTYRSNHQKFPGRLLRANLRQDIDAVSLWLEDKPFPKQIFSDQMCDCECKNTAL